MNSVQLVSQIEALFGVVLSVPSIFAHPTIQSQCELLTNSSLDTYIQPAPVSLVDPRAAQISRNLTKYHASMQQESLYFMELLHPKGPEYLVHFAAEIAGDVNKHDLESSVAEIARRHEQALKSYFVMENDILYACVSNAPLEIQYHDWTSAPDVLSKIEQ